MLRRSFVGVFVLSLVCVISAGAQMKESAKSHPRVTMKKNIVDINSASEADLTVLLGIDHAAAKKIVEGRPYRNKYELISRQVLTADQYNKVKDLIVAKQPKKKNGE